MYKMIRESWYYTSAKGCSARSRIEHGQSPLNQGHSAEGQEKRPISQGCCCCCC